MNDRATILKIKEFVDQTKGKMKITTVFASREVQTDRGIFTSKMESELEASGNFTDNLREAQIAYLLLAMETSISAWRSALSESAITVVTFDTKVKDLKKNTMAHLSRIIPQEEAKEKTA